MFRMLLLHICYILIFYQQQLGGLVLGETAATTSCSQGFMDSNLLTIKAAQIPEPGGSRGPPRPSSIQSLAKSGVNTRWLSGFSFIDFGIIVQVLLAVDIRSIEGNRNQYPRIEVWSALPSNDTQPPSSLVTSLPINFTFANITNSSSGIYRYTFPAIFNRGFILGLYQPADERSVVRVYGRNQTNASAVRIKGANINNTVINIGDLLGENVAELNVEFLIHLVTSIIK